jgi:hypothetical protein
MIQQDIGDGGMSKEINIKEQNKNFNRKLINYKQK